VVAWLVKDSGVKMENKQAKRQQNIFFQFYRFVALNLKILKLTKH
jgi:hypothetical protein